MIRQHLGSFASLVHAPNDNNIPRLYNRLMAYKKVEIHIIEKVTNYRVNISINTDNAVTGEILAGVMKIDLKILLLCACIYETFFLEYRQDAGPRV